MPKHQQDQLSVTKEQTAAFRLSRHHLSERASKKSLLSVAYDMVGTQAQLLSAAQISFWSRVSDLQLKDVEAAVDKQRLVKAASMCRTLFLVPAKHLAVFVRDSARRAQKEINWALKKDVEQRVIDKVIDATMEALEEPLTRTEIAEVEIQIG